VYGIGLFKDCKLNASATMTSSGGILPIPALVDLTRCDSGGTAYRNERYHWGAVETTSTTVVRTGGASDGATSISHRIATTVNLVAINSTPVSFFPALPLVIWNAVTGSNRSVTLYGIANDSRVPNNDEVWFDCEYLGSASSPQGSIASGTKSNMLATASSLTADTSAWDSAATARANSHAYSVGDVIKTASNPGRIFFCTTAGTSAGSEPGGYATATDGGSITDSGATFRAGCRFSQTLTLGGTAYWNPADRTASVLLTNSNLTADVSVAGNQSVRCANGQATGKFYFEVLCNHVRYNEGQSIGIATISAPLSTFMTGGTPGSGTAAFALLQVTGMNVYVNGTQQMVFASQPNNGDTVCVAVDMTNKRIWFRINNGNWNDNVTYNPATNVGGQDISSVFSSAAAYPFLYGNSIFGTGDMVMTSNFGASSFTFTVPSGFQSGLPLTAQPQQPGYLYAYPKFGRASTTYYLDPLIKLS
jgi:hypothetical protein